MMSMGSVDAATYEKIRLSAEREKLQKQVQQLDQKIQQLAPMSTSK